MKDWLLHKGLGLHSYQFNSSTDSAIYLGNSLRRKVNCLGFKDHHSIELGQFLKIESFDYNFLSQVFFKLLMAITNTVDVIVIYRTQSTPTNTPLCSILLWSELKSTKEHYYGKVISFI